MRHKLNIVLLFMVFMVIVLGCEPKEPRFYNGEQLINVDATAMLVDYYKNGSLADRTYKDKLLLVHGSVSSVGDSSVTLEGNLSSYNLLKSGADKITATLTVTCKIKDSEKPKLSAVLHRWQHRKIS